MRQFGQPEVIRPGAVQHYQHEVLGLRGGGHTRLTFNLRLHSGVTGSRVRRGGVRRERPRVQHIAGYPRGTGNDGEIDGEDD